MVGRNRIKTNVISSLNMITGLSGEKEGCRTGNIILFKTTVNNLTHILPGFPHTI